MKNQMTGIALVLLGILLECVPWDISAMQVAGIVLGLIGLAVVFWNGNWKDENGQRPGKGGCDA